MAAKTSKAKSKRRLARRTTASRTTSKPLLAATAVVRRAKPAPRVRARNAAPSPSVNNPVFMMTDLLGRVMTAYAELPARLAQCRTPMDVWREQLRFAQRVFG
jgi:hypothetical protein